MQSVAIYQNTADGLKADAAELGPQAAELAKLRATYEQEQRAILQTLHDEAVRRKENGNRALECGEFRSAVKEYNGALEQARAMMTYLDVDRPQPYNGYQLRALAQGRELPRRGPAALDPFRAVVHANRSLAFLRLDAYERAVDDAEEACRLEPRYLKGWIRRAAALVAANRRDDALTVLDLALDMACPCDALKEQVCKLIVNVSALGHVEVRPPQPELPVVYKGEERPKKKKAPREIVKVPVGMLKSQDEARKSATAEAEAAAETFTTDDASVFAEVDRRDLDVFLREDWHATHLGGRWRQSRDDVQVVVQLPRRPKVSEVLAQIQSRRVWVLLLKPGAPRGGGRENYETIVDAALANAVRPAESAWTLEADGVAELHFSLQKQPPTAVADAASDDVTPMLWDRAFEDDVPVEIGGLALAKAARAQAARNQVAGLLQAMTDDARQKRADGDKAGAKEVEKAMASLRERMEL